MKSAVPLVRLFCSLVVDLDFPTHLVFSFSRLHKAVGETQVAPLIGSIFIVLVAGIKLMGTDVLVKYVEDVEEMMLSIVAC